MRVIVLFLFSFVAAAMAADARSPVGKSETWSGMMRQFDEGGAASYPMTLTFDGEDIHSAYPKLSCGGVWTKIGTAPSGYDLFEERITFGFEGDGKGGTCINGIVVVSQMKGKIVLGWFAQYGGAAMLASAELVKSAK